MGRSEPRLTAQTLKVLGALLSAGDSDVSGADIARVTDLASGTLYPILLRLEEARWATSQWESGDPQALGRPRKRLYQITNLGAKRVRSAFQEIKTLMGAPAWQ